MTEAVPGGGRYGAVVGLDPSLTSTGIASVLGLYVAGYPLRQAEGTRARGRRIAAVTAAVAEHVAEVRMASTRADLPVLVVVEGFYVSGQPYAHERAGLWWRLAADLPSCELVQVAPATLKKYATGSGRAGKADVVAAFQRASGRSEKDDNAADAWWLYAAGCAALGYPVADVPEGRRLGLDVVDWPWGGVLPDAHPM